MDKLDTHRDIILEALSDYRRWWADQQGNDKVREIDRAIKYLSRR